jgi:D-alanine-D-alanine ligase
VAEALAGSGHNVTRLELEPGLAERLRGVPVDVVFPVVHGAVGEDGSLQGLLEVLELPYVGSGVTASAVAMNKRLAKVIFAAAGLPLASALYAERGGDASALAARALREVSGNVVVKPCSNGSAIGVFRFERGVSVAELAEAIESAWEVDEVAIVEQFAAGREVTCGVLGTGESAVAFSPTEIRAKTDAFYTYEARYAPGRSEHLCPAPLVPQRFVEVQRVAVAAHRALGCRDLSRVDFVVSDEHVTLLEVNTLPGFTKTSLYPEAAGVAGIPMSELCERLVLDAHRRGVPRRNVARTLPT